MLTFSLVAYTAWQSLTYSSAFSNWTKTHFRYKGRGKIKYVTEIALKHTKNEDRDT